MLADLLCTDPFGSSSVMSQINEYDDDDDDDDDLALKIPIRNAAGVGRSLYSMPNGLAAFTMAVEHQQR